MANVKTILTDVDPKADTALAIDRARQLAAVSGAKLHLLLSAYDASLTGGVLSDNEKMAAARDDYLSRLEDWLDERSRALSDAGIDVTTDVVWHWPRYDSLLSAAEELHADVIVRAARKHSAIDRLLFAATDWELVRRARQPVWIVKKPFDNAASGLKVVAAVDPTHPGEKKVGLDRKLMATADRIVKLLGGTLHVFHAYIPASAMTPAVSAGSEAGIPVLGVGAELMDELREQRTEEIDKLVRPFGVPEENVHLLAGDTKAALDDLVEEQGIDVVVAGAVSRGRLERLLVGSTAEAILGTVDCDVVVVKPDGFPAPN